jgi:S1-C subfamily serine protease/regulator of sirC expression with transglutaminase-like and TPR domain
MSVPYGVAFSLFGSAAIIALVQAHPAFALSTAQVDVIARQVTVKIEGQAPGSGVIIARQGQAYYVLTAAHVVATADEYDVVTPDGKKHRLDYKLVRKLPNVDLAIVQFSSLQTYKVATIGSSNQLKITTPVYVAGFPQASRGSSNAYRFSEGEINAVTTRPIGSGYTLAYWNETFSGMSGGPIFNQEGQLIGIHGSSLTGRRETQGIDPDNGFKIGLNMGIPVDTFLRLAPQVIAIPKFPPAPSQVIPSQLTASDFFVQGIQDVFAYVADRRIQAIAAYTEAIRLQPDYASAYFARASARAVRDPQGALEDYNQAIRLNPNFYIAYVNRGSIHGGLGDYQAALTDYDQALRINPNLAFAYTWRGRSRLLLRDLRGALADFDQAIRLRPNLVVAYSMRALLRDFLKDYRGAMTDYDQIIRLNPIDANAYHKRGVCRLKLGDQQGALTDFDQSIRLNPDDVETYLSRNTARLALGDRQGAVADAQKAVDLAKAKGNKDLHEKALRELKSLQR